MNNFIVLTKVLFKNSFNSIGTQKNKKKSIMLTLFVVFALMPLFLMLTKLTSTMYEGLAKINQEGLIMGLGFSAVSMAIFFFGIFYIITVFYFSKDIENLLPLPLKPYQILGAKFTLTIIFEYITELIFLLPIIVGYGFASNASILYYVYCLIIFLTLPVIPLILASIIDMIIMRFTGIVKNKDVFRMASGVIALFLALAVNAYVQKFAGSNVDPNQLIQTMTEGNNSLLNITSQLFPSSKVAAYAVVYNTSLQGLANLAVFILINILSIIIFLIIGEQLYFKGVIGISEVSSKRKTLSRNQLNKTFVRKSKIWAYAKKELHLLFRTPAYFMNCVLMNFLWPVFLALPFIFQPQALNDFDKLRALSGNTGYFGIVIAVVFAMSLFLASTNCVTASSISRDGQEFYINKYLPISYEEQISAKVLSGLIMGAIGISLLIIVSAIIFQPPLYLLILCIIVSILAIILNSFTGIILDMYNPKLIWDNEQKAVKQNMNTALNMLTAVIIAAVAFVPVLLFKLNIWAVFISIVFISGLANVLLFRYLKTAGVKMYGEIE